jgi:DNA-binding FadR family transcriptional regulator
MPGSNGDAGKVPLRAVWTPTIAGIDDATATDRPTRVPKAADLVAQLLRRSIVLGEAPVGEPLASEADLMERFGVSRPTLRAALHILETESLVEVRRGSRGGTWVRSPSIDVTARRAGAYLQYYRVTVDDVHRARVLIEPPAVAILAERREADDIERLRATLAAQQAAVDDREQSRLIGERFHEEIVELAGNQTLILFSAMLREIIDIHIVRSQAVRAERGDERRAPAMYTEHDRVLELIAAGAAGEAELWWRTHLEHVRLATTEGNEDTGLDLMR